MMLLAALTAYVLAGYFAYDSVRHPQRRLRALWIPCVWVGVIAYLTLLAWPWFTDEHALILDSLGSVWGGIMVLYGLWGALFPAGLLRLVGSGRSVARGAAVATLLAPFLALLVFHLLGDPHATYGEGFGSVWDLLFLDPFELANGTRHDGFVTHRFRIHFLVLGALVLASSLLHLLPVAQRDDVA